ncbi:sensor histidine kinase [Desulfoscipio sp. XC116]|uniref:sensor histidine kinase n=1 Tax=Desulfoscipio sp. XC116 TaxID=3144975 RepID=UPI00325B4BB7
MNLLVNKEVKNFLILLALVFFLGIILSQIIAYIHAVHFKNEIIVHDYEVAGYLKQKHPELALEIQEAFTADKLPNHIETGKALLEQSGYKNSIELHLIPRMDKFHKTIKANNLIFSTVFLLVILLIVYIFLKAHYQKIDQYNYDVSKIMNGEISTRLADNGEGSLSKLATSINTLTASLYTHIEKEKQNRGFLKDILTNVSHQLKTPLSALTMYTDIMRNENTDNEVIVRFLNKSEKELGRMQTLIANLLKMAKLDAGIIELNKSTYNVNDIIKQVAESFDTRLSKEQKTFTVKSTGKVSYLCDREWMLEAVSNLFKNAVEHTEAGNHIRTRIEETPLIIKIAFEDNGEGIHPDDINHIFKRFYKSKFSQNKQGTGIGLSLAKTIIEMHGGFISVESTFKKGTKFTVHLPNLQNCKV